MTVLPLWDGSSSCTAHGINIHREIVGTCTGAFGTRGVRWDANGVPNELPGTRTAEDINDAGAITGALTAFASPNNPRSSPYRYTPQGGFQNLGWSGNHTAPSGSGYAINESNVVAGQTTRFWQFGTCGGCPFTFVDSLYAFRAAPGLQILGKPFLSPADGYQAYGLGVNEAGVVVGWSHGAVQGVGTLLAFSAIWTADTIQFIPLGLPNNTVSQANEINDQGVVAGEYTLSGQKRAYLWRQGVPRRDIAPLPGGTSATALALNNADAQGALRVVGWSTVPGGQTHATVWIEQAP
jgi:uncharacterized membrane protein